MLLTIILFLLTLQQHTISAAISIPSDEVFAFNLDSLEIRPLPYITGLTQGKTGIIIRIDTALFDYALQRVHIGGWLWERQDKIGISSYTVGLAKVEQRGESFLMTSRLQVLSDAEGHFSIHASINEDDFLFISWYGYIYKLYRVGTLVHFQPR